MRDLIIEILADIIWVVIIFWAVMGLLMLLVDIGWL